MLSGNEDGGRQLDALVQQKTQEIEAETAKGDKAPFIDKAPVDKAPVEKAPIDKADGPQL